MRKPINTRNRGRIKTGKLKLNPSASIKKSNSTEIPEQNSKQIVTASIINTVPVTPDPNLYLKDDPVQSGYMKLAKNINYTHVIITRFSYRFSKNAPIGNLFNSKRMKRRFHLLESFCLPSILGQKNKNFYWVLVIDKDLPDQYIDRLHKLISKFYSSDEYGIQGPRQIFLYKWQYNYSMSGVEWLREMIPIEDKKYLITTRLDDDDSLCKNFTNLVKSQLVTNKIRGFFLITFESGYYWYPQVKTKYGIFKPATKPYIAIGLTLITNLEKYPFTVYFGNHTKLVHYIRNYKNHKLLKRMCDNNKETINDKNHKEKYKVVKRTKPVFIRTIHDHNLQKGMKNIYTRSLSIQSNNHIHLKNLENVKNGFSLNLKKIYKVNRKI